MSGALLFVYGSLRPGYGGEHAGWLARAARHVGRATVRGALYRIDYYPGLVPGGKGLVAGDLFLMPDPAHVLAVLDEHEECAAHFPQPHEYRRERLMVDAEGGAIEAWAYVYAREAAGLERIGSGDFLA